MPNRLLIMISGPYRSGAATEAARAASLRAMNQAAVAIWERGHIPLIGVNAVLPIIQEAGTNRYDELMMPICLELAARCDAVLRIDGPSVGADDEMERIRAAGGAVFARIEDIPAATTN
ncbi:MAG: DUF4406 domain-containing protein [Alphaproteobacteria bacterium]|nr:DUF4406 domain-containing protein [Alphaproteobacteria bacterium]